MKLLLIVIDGAAPRVFSPAVQTGRLETFRRLAEAGTLHSASASIFPSITPAATASIVTGCYPSEHGIEGAAWLKDGGGEVAYYGDDFWVIAREGLGHFLRDFLIHLNGDRLRAPTLFELVERAGRKAASLNYLVYRGLHEHQVELPKLLSILPGAPSRAMVLGPSILGLGALGDAQTRHATKRQRKAGPLHRFGMDDEGTGTMLCSLIESGTLPDFTVAYFADNDYRSHEAGPHAALKVLDRVDAVLGSAFELAGGLDAFLRDTAVVVTSDHGHCELLDDEARAVVRLDAVLGDVARLGTLGSRWSEHDEAMICPNMRAAQIYLHSRAPELRRRLIQRLLEEPRVDQVIWRADAVAGAPTYAVSSGAGTLQFGRAAEGREDGCDAFGGRWRWTGELATLDAHVDGRRLHFGDYPNAFERIEGALASEQSGDIWITARAGCEFEVPGGKAHVAGASHGALHALDSLSPVIVSGPSTTALPEHFRSVDIAPLCMDLLGLPMDYAVGESRGKRSR